MRRESNQNLVIGRKSQGDFFYRGGARSQGGRDGGKWQKKVGEFWFLFYCQCSLPTTVGR